MLLSLFLALVVASVHSLDQVSLYSSGGVLDLERKRESKALFESKRVLGDLTVL